MMHAGTPIARMWQLTIEQLRERIVGAGLLTDEEVERYLALYDDQGFVALGPIAMTVWGRRPD